MSPHLEVTRKHGSVRALNTLFLLLKLVASNIGQRTARGRRKDPNCALATRCFELQGILEIDPTNTRCKTHTVLVHIASSLMPEYLSRPTHVPFPAEHCTVITKLRQIARGSLCVGYLASSGWDISRQHHPTFMTGAVCEPREGRVSVPHAASTSNSTYQISARALSEDHLFAAANMLHDARQCQE